MKYNFWYGYRKEAQKIFNVSVNTIDEWNKHPHRNPEYIKWVNEKWLKLQNDRKIAKAMHLIMNEN